ncbi:MAG: hypothetical protein AAFQ82_21945 [Myxococcota bacterium]
MTTQDCMLLLELVGLPQRPSCFSLVRYAILMVLVMTTELTPISWTVSV